MVIISADGSPWVPTTYTKICSAHFIGEKKSEHPLHPGYIPSVFPNARTDVSHKTKHLRRFHRAAQKWDSHPDVDATDMNYAVGVSVGIQVDLESSCPVSCGKSISVLHCVMD